MSYSHLHRLDTEQEKSIFVLCTPALEKKSVTQAGVSTKAFEKLQKLHRRVENPNPAACLLRQQSSRLRAECRLSEHFATKKEMLSGGIPSILVLMG